MARGGRQSSVRGALYEHLYRRGVRHYSQPRVGTMGAALNFGTRVPGNLGGNGCFAEQSGLFPRFGGYSNVGRESGKGKTTFLRHLRHSKHLVAGAWFPRARPRMYRREVWVCCSQPYRGSLTYSMQF